MTYLTWSNPYSVSNRARRVSQQPVRLSSVAFFVVGCRDPEQESRKDHNKYSNSKP
jgi:hypothetical protein